MLHRITAATPEPGATVRLTYATGETVVVDMTPYLARGGVFTPLQDPTFFAQVVIGEQGRFLAWPGELEFCADALFITGTHETIGSDGGAPATHAPAGGGADGRAHCG